VKGRIPIGPNEHREIRELDSIAIFWRRLQAVAECLVRRSQRAQVRWGRLFPNLCRWIPQPRVLRPLSRESRQPECPLAAAGVWIHRDDRTEHFIVGASAGGASSREALALFESLVFPVNAGAVLPRRKMEQAGNWAKRRVVPVGSALVAGIHQGSLMTVTVNLWGGYQRVPENVGRRCLNWRPGPLRARFPTALENRGMCVYRAKLHTFKGQRQPGR
jgi:hypothetical protein